MPFVVNRLNNVKKVYTQKAINLKIFRLYIHRGKMTEIKQSKQGNYLQGSFSGTAAALGAYYVIGSTGLKIATEIKPKNINSTKNNSIYEKIIDKTLKDSNLTKHNVKIIKAQNLTDEGIGKLINEIHPPKKITNPLSKLSRWYIKNEIYAAKRGDISYYIYKPNKILVNTETNSLDIFHEMGHAQNNFSKWSKYIRKATHPAVLSAILLISIFKKKKNDGETPTGIIDKSTDFIKENCGTLTLAAKTPELVDEGLASIRGLKLAKPYLSPKNYNHLKLYYGKAGLTYIIYAATLAVGTKLASIISDKMSK